MRRVLAALVAVGSACSSAPSPTPAGNQASSVPAASKLHDPREVHLADVRQLSFGGENAEAYWSFSGDQLIFQTTRPPFACDQIMTMPSDGSAEPVLVSTGKGRTTCAYFLPGPVLEQPRGGQA